MASCRQRCWKLKIPPQTLERDWPWLGLDRGVYFVPAAERDSEFAYGVWRTLAWITGTRTDPRVELPKRDAAGAAGRRPAVRDPGRTRRLASVGGPKM